MIRVGMRDEDAGDRESRYPAYRGALLLRVGTRRPAVDDDYSVAPHHEGGVDDVAAVLTAEILQAPTEDVDTFRDRGRLQCIIGRTARLREPKAHEHDRR